MSVQVKHRRDTAANIAGFTPAQGELIVDTTNNRLLVGDGATAGGWPMAKLSEVATTLRRTVADANATIASTDRLVAYTALTAARTVALPPAAAFPAATLLTIIDESGACSASNTITINRAGADTIAGGASFVLNGAYMSILLESDGVSKWTPLANDVNETFATLGVGTAPDPANPLSVYGASALFNGANFSFTVNKSAAANVASVIFEDNFSLRAQIGLLNSDQLQIKVSPNGSSYFTGLTFDNATGAPTFGNARTAVADSNYTALTTDRVIALTAITAARSVTLPAASAFPSGHALVIVDESGAVSATNSITIARSGSDTISGLTNATISAAYGHCRLLSNGANGWVVTGRSVNVQVFAGSGTYVPTPGMTKCEVYLVGGGGGGGGGALQATSNAASGGGGGGGAGANFGVFTAAQVGSSRIVTIGAAGTAGAAATASGTAGGNGGQGGATQFGSLLKASGGGGGSGGQLAGASAGGGGGSTLSAGGNASGASAGVSNWGAGAGGSGASSASVTIAQFGVGGAGSTAAGAATNSGYSTAGPTGGGSGGGLSVANATSAGGSGGVLGVPGVAGAAGGAAGASGSPGVTATGLAGGTLAGGGGGGGGSSLTAAGAGGAGVNGGGGGGGGSAQNGGSAGAGGAGGAGYCLILESF